MTRPGLDIVARRWRGVKVDRAMQWQRVAQINASILQDLDSAGLSDKASQGDCHRLYDEWTFPMYGVDLFMIEVSDQQLEAQRDAWLGAQY